MSWIKDEDMKAIRQNADIVDVISNYITLDKKGKDYKAICPFHDDHDPSLSVSVDKQIFKCFVCGTGGNVFTFVQKIEQISFPEAVVKVAGMINYPLEMPTESFRPKVDKNQPLYDILNNYIQFLQYELKSQDGQICSQYLSRRHISSNIISRFEIGYAPEGNKSLRYLQAKNFSTSDLISTGLLFDEMNQHVPFFDRLMIPIHDENGNPVGFTARRLSEDKSISKYINTTQTPIYEKGNLIFNYHRAKEHARKAHKCILVEGAMDVIAYEKADIHYALACLGTAITKNQIQLLKRLQVDILVGYDGDQAGRNATYKFAKLALEAGLSFQVIKNTSTMDPDEIIETYGKDELVNRISNTVSYVEFLFDYLTSVYDLNNYEDKKKYAQEIFEVVNQTCDSFEKPMYIRKIQSTTGFDFSMMITNEKPQRSIPTKTHTVIQPLAPGRIRAERAILACILVSKNAANRFKEEIGFFQDRTCNQLSLYCYDMYRKMDSIDMDSLLAHIDEEDVRNLCIEIISDIHFNKELNETYFKDSMIKIKECAINDQINHINAQIEQMTSPQNKAKLALQKNELIIKKLNLRNQEVS